MRKLVDILINHLQLDIEAFNIHDEAKLRSPMVNCRNWMEEKDLTSLFKIIAQIYNLSKTPEGETIFPG